MIKTVNNYNIKEEASNMSSEKVYRSNILNFSNGSRIYIKDNEKVNNSNNIDEISELSNEDINLTKDEWETVLTLNNLEYLIVIRSTKRIGRRNTRNKQNNPIKLHNTKPKELETSPKRKRSSSFKSDSHQCPNCLTTDSALWRNCVIKGKSHHYCNACGLRFKKGKFCPLCYKVYYDADTNTREWKQCNICYNWTHNQCLIDSGKEIKDNYICNLCNQEEE